LKVFSLIMAIYFALGSLFPVTDFAQLAKVPNMWEHYTQHRDMAVLEGKEAGFVDFLRLHFYSPSEHQGEHEHDDLPYHSANSGSNNLLVIDIPLVWKPEIEIRSFKAEFCYLLNYHFNYSATLLQPPVRTIG
jgi:hypothetical protein